MTYTARYEGVCVDCGGHVEPGELVMNDEEDELVHVDCSAVPRDGAPA